MTRPLKTTDNDRRIIKKAMELVVKSPKLISEMEQEVRDFLRNARAEGRKP